MRCIVSCPNGDEQNDGRMFWNVQIQVKIQKVVQGEEWSALLSCHAFFMILMLRYAYHIMWYICDVITRYIYMLCHLFYVTYRYLISHFTPSLTHLQYAYYKTWYKYKNTFSSRIPCVGRVGPVPLPKLICPRSRPLYWSQKIARCLRWRGTYHVLLVQ